MSDGAYYLGLVLAMLVVCVWGVWHLRPPKAEPTTPNHARLIVKPGATLDLVNDEGLVVAKVVLNSVTRSTGGTSAEFVDFFQYTEGKRFK